MYAVAGADPADPPAIGALCKMLTGHAPEFVRMREPAYLPVVNGERRVYVRVGTDPARARWLVGHELAEWWYLRTAYRGEDVELRCDALGAALVAPRPAFLLALRARGHRVHELAKDFKTTQALALLRIGETTGRPVALVRPTPILRGEGFAWPTGPGLARAVRQPPPSVHPIRVDGRFGLMARA